MKLIYDFIIIGGGILGASTAMQLKERHPDNSILLIEKENVLAKHQTGNNSGVIHAGVYYKPGSLKADFCTRGNIATKNFCQEHSIPFENCGKLLVATNDLEMKRMHDLWVNTEQNGIDRYWLSQNELTEKEPNVRGIGAIFVPSSGIVNYSTISQAMVDKFQSAGGQIKLGAEVKNIHETNDQITISTTQGDFKAQHMISCAGLMSDRIVKMMGIDPGLSICPFRGEYYQLPKQKQDVVKHLIYPIPDPSVPFLGVHLTPMIDGSITVGPNAVLALKREGYKKTDIDIVETIRMLSTPGVLKLLSKNFSNGLREMKNSYLKNSYLKEVTKYCPQITTSDLLPYPAGVRAQAISYQGKLIDDFVFVNSNRSFNVCNAPSPAATSAIPIGEHICNEIEKTFN